MRHCAWWGRREGREGRQLWLGCSELLRQAQHCSNRLTFRTEKWFYISNESRLSMFLCEQNETLISAQRLLIFCRHVREKATPGTNCSNGGSVQYVLYQL
jgi:hypothetical protein